MKSTSPKIIQKNFLPEVVSRLLGFLSEQEQDIIKRRFQIDHEGKQTLQKIGDFYSVTRERVRQIQLLALQKLIRISQDSDVKSIHSILVGVIEENNGVISEERFVKKVIEKIPNTTIKDHAVHIIFMARICEKIEKQDKNPFFNSFYFLPSVFKLEEIKHIISQMKSVLKEKGSVMSVVDITKDLNDKYHLNIIESLLESERFFFKTAKGMWGFVFWRDINPKSIKDFIYITLKKEKTPMHFREIIDMLRQNFLKKKKFTEQAVHNELIRYSEFVLVGRGIYGLSQWGYAVGTVCDLIFKVFEENNFKPLKRQFIISEVLKKREIRFGTISLTLQKYDCFERTGRAVYEYRKDFDLRKEKRIN